MSDDDPLAILLIEDNPGDVRLLQEFIVEIEREGLLEGIRGKAGNGLVITHAEDLETALEALKTPDFDIVLADLQLPDSTGLETVKAVTSAVPEMPVIVLTGMPEEELGIEAVSHGAQDYLPKDEMEPRLLLKTIQYAIHRNEQERAFRQQSEQLSLLTRMTRHDVRNDVSLIVGRAQELTEYVDPRGQERVEEIIQSGNHVLRLTQTIGDALEEITSDSNELTRIQLAPVIDQEVQQATSLYRGAEVTIGSNPDVEIRANHLISSVLANLINNGIFYNDKSVPKVHIDVEPKAETIEIRVEDNGPGIPPEQTANLFEADSKSGEQSGLGVGLALVRRFVNQFGGSIRVEPNDPEGSVFIVELERA